MNRKVKLALVGVGATSVVVGTAAAASLSYVTASGDVSRWGVRVFRYLRVEEALRAHLIRKSDREQGIPLPLRRYVDSLEGKARTDFIDKHNDERMCSNLPVYRF